MEDRVGNHKKVPHARGTHYSHLALFGASPCGSASRSPEKALDKKLFYSSHFQPIIHDPLDLIGMHGLAIDAHDRFCATKPDE